MSYHIVILPARVGKLFVGKSVHILAFAILEGNSNFLKAKPFSSGTPLSSTRKDRVWVAKKKPKVHRTHTHTHYSRGVECHLNGFLAPSFRHPFAILAVFANSSFPAHWAACWSVHHMSRNVSKCCYRCLPHRILRSRGKGSKTSSRVTCSITPRSRTLNSLTHIHTHTYTEDPQVDASLQTPVGVRMVLVFAAGPLAEAKTERKKKKNRTQKRTFNQFLSRRATSR